MKSAWRKPFTVFFSAAGILTLAVLFVNWWMNHSFPALSRVMAILSLLLFAAVGLLTVQAWGRFWFAEPEKHKINRKSEKPVSGRRIFLFLLGWDLTVLLLAWPLRCALLGPMSLMQSMREWVCGDGIHYLDIARDWYLSTGTYDRVVQLVFLPGYPVAIRLAHLLIPEWTYAALTVSGLCFAGAGVVLYRLLALDLDSSTALRSMAILCLLPGSFFFSAAMSESLFLLCCAGCLYLARTKRWLPACLIGGYAAFTRSLGITLLVPLVVELVYECEQKNLTGRKLWSAAASLLLIPFGFAVYLLINRQVSGNPFQFLIYQSEHWHQSLGCFFHSAAYQTDYAMHTLRENPHHFLGLWLPNLIATTCALVIMIIGARIIRPSYSVWFIPYYFIAIGATWLLSAPRYLIVFFPIAETLSIVTKNRILYTVLIICISVASVLYFLAFLHRWQVW